MKGFLSCLLWGFSILVYASDELSMDVSVKDSSFVIILDANPTTGYQWSVVQYDKNLLTLTASNFEKPKTTLIGAGGQMHFTFALQKNKTFPANTEIKLKYARSWEPKSATFQNVKVNFIPS